MTPTYEVKQNKDGKWRINETVLKGSVTHHGILQYAFDSEEEAWAKVEQIKAAGAPEKA